MIGIVTNKEQSRLPGGAALNLERRLSYRFSILSAKVARAVAQMYGSKYGLLLSGWKAMAAIGRYGPVSAKEVCAHTTVESAKVTRAVDRLVERGYARREQDRVDRRRVVLTLTPTGQKVYTDIEVLTRSVELELLGALSVEDRKSLDHILVKLEGMAGKCLNEDQSWRKILEKRKGHFANQGLTR